MVASSIASLEQQMWHKMENKYYNKKYIHFYYYYYYGAYAQILDKQINKNIPF